MSGFIDGEIVDMIRARGALRTPGLALHFEVTEAEIDGWLAPYCAAGQLISCGVELAGGKRVTEYRCSVAGGGSLISEAYTAGRPRTKLEQKTDHAFGSRAAIRKEIAEQFKSAPPAPPAPKPTKPRKEVDAPMKTTIRIIRAIEKLGPMSLPKIRSVVDEPNMSTICSQLVKKGQLVKLGGEPKKTIYGLPGQKAPANASATTAPKAPGKTGLKPGKKPAAWAARLSGATIALGEDRLHALLADALHGRCFQLSAGETRELAEAAYLPKERA